MAVAEPLDASVARAFTDVVATTGIRLELAAWPGRDRPIGWVVHEAGVRPQRPVWEAVGLLKRGDCIALHPWPSADRHEPGYGDANDVTETVAAKAQDLLHMMLCQRGLDPTWPRCPTHPGSHPLGTLGRSLSWELEDGHPVVTHDTGGMWICPRGDVAIPIGQLTSVRGVGG